MKLNKRRSVYSLACTLIMLACVNFVVITAEGNHLRQEILRFQHETQKFLKLAEIKFSYADANEVLAASSLTQEALEQREVQKKSLKCLMRSINRIKILKYRNLE